MSFQHLPRYRPLQIVRNLARALGMVWRIAARWTTVNAALVLLQGLLPLAALYIVKLVVDFVTENLAAPDKSAVFQQALGWIALAGAVTLFSSLARALSEYAAEAQSLHVTDAIANILHDQSIAVDLRYYEDPSYYDTLHRAQKEAPFRPTKIVNGLIQLAQNGISLLSILALLISFGGWMAALLMLVGLPGIVLRMMHSKRLYTFDKTQTEKERRSNFYHSVLVDVPFAKEVRLFDLGGLFKERYRQLRTEIREGKLALGARRVRSELLAQTLVTLALFGALAWLAWRALNGMLSLGDVLVYFLGFQNGLNFLQSLLKALAGLYEDNLFLTNLYRFLDLQPAIQSPPNPLPVPAPLKSGLYFENLTFQYPGRTQPALQDVNIRIAPGEVIALVGENGSGKTTLVKLLCRLYDPTQGAILADGINLRDFDPSAWRRQVGVTFQDFARYAMTIRENIWLGNTETTSDLDRISQAAERAGADEFIRDLPQGYETMLGHWFFQGQELSGGEWQKIALARNFWREANILVLDEPTSALDAIAEEKLFHAFRSVLAGRTGILISHRFSTVQMADCIYVLDNGKVIESGTHAELLSKNGQYARLYQSQAQYYQ